ncbi:glycoside hydrolase family 28 protein [Marinifilum caeruleilacunae]|nr:glycosyl hydrolase family 28 protein [Marinifilum caeruleilacunae]
MNKNIIEKKNILQCLLASLFIIICINTTIAQTYTLECNGKTIPVMEQNDVPLSYQVSTYKYSRVSYEGAPLSLRVDCSGFDFNNSDWDISPHSYGIKGTKKGNSLSFVVNKPGYVVVRFKKDQDFTKRLVILIEEPEVLPEGNFVDIIKTYGVDNSGQTNETEKIQKALNDISGSGKVLLFPEGTYKTFMLQLKSNSKIHLSKNARIKADASEIESYLAKENEGIDRFIYLDQVENIQVTGLGTFDANGSEILAVNPPKMASQSTHIRLMFMYKSKNISFEGPIFKDPTGWNTHIMGCQDVTFKKCKIMNNLINNEFFGSLDGWDPDGSKKVLIENCFGWAGDDNVAVKCTGYGNLEVYDDVEDIIVRNCVFLTKKTSLKIGTETRCANYKRIVFQNNDIIEADRALGVNVRDRANVNGVLFKDIRTEYYYPDRKQMPINVYITRREEDQPWTGKINNVVFENCSFEQMFPKKIQVSRIESHTKNKDLQITFKNVTIEGEKVISVDADYFNLKKTNGIVKFK